MRPLAASVLVTILAVACAAATPSPTVKPLATITITSPKAGETIAAGTVMVTYEISDVVLVPAASAAKPEDYHLHVFLDLDTSPYVGKDLLVPAGDANPNPSRIIHTAAKSVTFNNVTAGEHTVTVFLTFSSHVSVKPPVSATSKFTVR